MILNNCNPIRPTRLFPITACLFMFILSGVSDSCSAQAMKLFRDSCCLSAAKPVMLGKGDRLTIGCDTAYVITAHRYRLYEKARTYLVTLSGNTDKMARQVENSVNSLDDYFHEIQSRYFLLSEEVKKTQSENAATLRRVNTELDQSRSDLQTARNEIESVRNNLKHARRNDIKNRWIFGGVGLSAGIVLGALLVK